MKGADKPAKVHSSHTGEPLSHTVVVGSSGGGAAIESIKIGNQINEGKIILNYILLENLSARFLVYGTVFR